MILSEIVQIYNYTNPVTKQDLFFKWLPVISPIIVIITFLFNNRYNAKTKRIESKRAWYFKAYFEPQIKKVEEFFNSADEVVKGALDEMSQSEYIGQERVEYVGSILFKLSNAKRKFEIEVLEVIKSNYPDIASTLGSILMSFEDANSNAFEIGSTDAYFEYIKSLNEIKSDLIKSLSQPAL